MQKIARDRLFNTYYIYKLYRLIQDGTICILTMFLTTAGTSSFHLHDQTSNYTNNSSFNNMPDERINRKAVVVTDTELWARLRQDDREAFSGIFRNYHLQLLHYGNSITRYHSLVADAIQDVFTDLWTYRHSLSTPASVKAYLLSSLRRRIARKLERDRIFPNSSDIETIEYSASFTVLDQLIEDEDTLKQVQQLNQYLNQLPPRQKEALYLRYYQNLSLEQIALLMEMNKQSVANLLHRSLRHLRELWIGEIPYLGLLYCLCQ